MKKLNINKVVRTHMGEPVRSLEIISVNSAIKRMTAPIEVIRGEFRYYDSELRQAIWIRNTWNLDGTDRSPISEVENHNLIEVSSKIIQRVQLTLF